MNQTFDVSNYVKFTIEYLKTNDKNQKIDIFE
jgi:hypothetical protein